MQQLLEAGPVRRGVAALWSGYRMEAALAGGALVLLAVRLLPELLWRVVFLVLVTAFWAAMLRRTVRMLRR